MMTLWIWRVNDGLSDINNKNLIKSLRDFLIGLSRPAKQVVAVGADAAGFAFSAVAAAWLLFGTDLTIDQLVRICLVTTFIALPLAWSQGLYRSVVRRSQDCRWIRCSWSGIAVFWRYRCRTIPLGGRVLDHGVHLYNQQPLPGSYISCSHQIAQLERESDHLWRRFIRGSTCDWPVGG